MPMKKKIYFYQHFSVKVSVFFKVICITARKTECCLNIAFSFKHMNYHNTKTDNRKTKAFIVWDMNETNLTTNKSGIKLWHLIVRPRVWIVGSVPWAIIKKSLVECFLKDNRSGRPISPSWLQVRSYHKIIFYFCFCWSQDRGQSRPMFNAQRPMSTSSKGPGLGLFNPIAKPDDGKLFQLSWERKPPGTDAYYRYLSLFLWICVVLKLVVGVETLRTLKVRIHQIE